MANGKDGQNKQVSKSKVSNKMDLHDSGNDTLNKSVIKSPSDTTIYAPALQKRLTPVECQVFGGAGMIDNREFETNQPDLNRLMAEATQRQLNQMPPSVQLHNGCPEPKCSN